MRHLLLLCALLITFSATAQEGFSITYGITYMRAQMVDSMKPPILDQMPMIEYSMGCSEHMSMVQVGFGEKGVVTAMYIDYRDSTVYGNVAGIKFQSSYDITEMGTSPYAIKDSSIRYMREERKEIMGMPVFKAKVSMDYTHSSHDKDITAWVTDAVPCDRLIFTEIKELNYLKYVPLAFTVQTDGYHMTYEATEFTPQIPEALLNFDKSEYALKDKEMIRKLWEGE